MTSRLLILAVFPVVGLLAYAAPTTVDRFDTVQRATQIEQTVDHLANLVAVRSALQAERVPTEAAMRVGAVGVSLADASTLLGFHISERLRHDAVQTDAAVTALGSAPSVIDLQDVQDLRAAAGANRIDADTYVTRLAALFQRLVAPTDAALSDLEVASGHVAGGGPLNDILPALRWGTESVESAHDQLNALERLFLGSGDPQTLSFTLVRATARQDIATGELDAMRVPVIEVAWRKLAAAEGTTRFHDSVKGAFDGSAPQLSAGPADISRLAAIARDGLGYEEDLYGFVSTASDEARAVTVALKDKVVGDLRNSSLFAGALMVLTVLISLLFARSISRPLRRLAAQATALSAGDLAVEVAVGTGPSDITVTSEAFGDLVANLRLLDAKARALAACDFDAEVLAETVPGPLGESLQESVRVMSGSLTERDSLQRHVVHQATHDALTGLHNRAAAAETLEQALGRSRRTGIGLAVLIVDLDGFQRMNDILGNAGGDRILCEVAARLKGAVRTGDFVARLGSDEFVVITENVREFGEATVLAHRLLGALAAPVSVGSTTQTIGASIGISLTTDGDAGSDQLLRSADLAVKRAKQRKPGSVEIFDEHLQETLLAQAAIEEALGHALISDELLMHYQPVIDIPTGQLSGLEALVRWDRPGFGLQPPDSFIPIAETTNQIVDLDQWVLARVARQVHAWRRDVRLSTADVAVNISGRHLLGHDLPRHMDQLLATTTLDPNRLIVEITETVLVDDLASAAVQLGEIRDRGIRIAIDDFGTGFTSITHLQQLPVDIVKIDRSFVDRAADERDRTLLALIIDVGHHLGLTITAEGVETAEQLEVLQQLGCDQAQGYFLGRPMPADRLVDWTVPGDARIGSMGAASGV